jgi:hypothetical protein
VTKTADAIVELVGDTGGATAADMYLELNGPSEDVIKRTLRALVVDGLVTYTIVSGERVYHPKEA